MSSFELFDRSRIRLRSLSERGCDLVWSDCLPLAPPGRPLEHPELPELIGRIVEAKRRGRAVILMMGAHPIKLGLSRFLVDLVERRLVTHIAINGGALIHDFELATTGGTSENTARWIKAGQFGLWRETSRLNDIICHAAERELGLGEAVGRAMEEEQPPWRHLSLAAACWRCHTPLTVHVGIGCDIIHAMANCDGAALGHATYTDFLIFARSMEHLEGGGVYLNVGTAVTGPEVYLKALSMARNVAHQEGRRVCDFATAVFDLVEIPDTFRDVTPKKDEAMYYYRPWKTILVRTVSDGGISFFFSGDHRQTIPTLWHLLTRSGDQIA